MKFDTLLVALQELEISIEEFELFLNNYNISPSDTLINEIDKTILKNSPDAFYQLHKQFEGVGQWLFALAAQSNIPKKQTPIPHKNNEF